MAVSEAGKQARRLNAQRSTGPKSRRGKARVAQNALVHGLSRPYRLTPKGPEDIERLAKALLQELGFSEEQISKGCNLWNAAYSFAEAHLDLDRIQALRDERLKAEIVKSIIPTRKQQQKVFSFADKIKDDDEAIDYVERNLQIIAIRSNPERGEKYHLFSKNIDPLYRYERRAFSKMKKALRMIMAIMTTP